nr:MAG TPA: hypothetical protein [Bacteriophage sp.]DAJ65634.1 MAG TPA: hypothetical protein [Caudoviricetes sp.]DAT68538.1 MAG TPA: hypothetical protein [Caudoviricetes sp.]
MAFCHDVRLMPLFTKRGRLRTSAPFEMKGE